MRWFPGQKQLLTTMSGVWVTTDEPPQPSFAPGTCVIAGGVGHAPLGPSTVVPDNGSNAVGTLAIPVGGRERYS